MRTLHIKHIGPIQEAKLDLKKINILIGAQSTGKSTIAKVLSYCTWVEKEISLSLTPEKFKEEGFFEENLVEFHKLHGFISDQSEIEFSTPTLNFLFKNRKFTFEWKDFSKYKRIKTLYIPAERNIVAVIPNWFEVSLKRNNTRSYLADWERVRRNYNEKQPLNLLDLGSYQYDDKTKGDDIFISEDKKIKLDSASSGLQTLTPLLSLFNYYSQHYYLAENWLKEENIRDAEQRAELLLWFVNNYIVDKSRQKEEDTIWSSFVLSLDEGFYAKGKEIMIKHINENKTNTDEITEHFTAVLVRFINNIHTPHSTAFFIEEPEQNLYPTAQRDLINHMAAMLHEQSHTLFITTHSPYLLTSINNLLYASEAAETDYAATNKIIPNERWILPHEVAAWKICDKNRTLIPLLEEDIAMLRAEEIDDVSNTINEEFDALFDIINQ